MNNIQVNKTLVEGVNTHILRTTLNEGPQKS